MTDGNGKNCMSPYEEEALKAIWAWKKPGLSFLESLMRRFDWDRTYLKEQLGTILNDIPDVPDDVKAAGRQIADVFANAAAGGLALVNDGAMWMVRVDVILAEYRRDGANVSSLSDVHDLDLEVVDRTIGYLDAKYKALAAVEGGAAGWAGLPGIPADVAALMTLSLRCVGEYATYCGFDVSLQQERLFALNVLALASSPTDASKQFAMAQLVRISRNVAAKRAWTELDRNAIVLVCRKMAELLGFRLTKAKLAQIIPILGAVVGAGFNSYYMTKVTNAAFYLYRERLLAERCGEDVIEIAVDPAPEITANDPDLEMGRE